MSDAVVGKLAKWCVPQQPLEKPQRRAYPRLRDEGMNMSVPRHGRTELLGTLIEQMYAAAIGELAYSPVAKTMQRFIGTDFANVLLMRPDRTVVGGGTSGLTEADRLDYITRWGDSDPFPLAMLAMPADTVVTLRDMMPERMIYREPVFEDFYEPHGIIYQGGAHFRLGNGFQAGISAQNGWRAGRLTAQQLRDVGLVSRRLRAAMRTGRVVQELRLRATNADQLLSRWDVALVSCESSGRVLDLQGGYETLLRRFAGVIRVHAGRLAIMDRKAHQRLRELLVDPARGRGQAGPTLSVRDNRANAVLECTVIAFDSASRADHLGGHRLLVLRDSTSPTLIDTHHLRRCLALTPGEADVLARLMLGGDASAIADARGSTAETIRSYLRALRRKLKCHTQSQLVACGWRAIGFVPSTRTR